MIPRMRGMRPEDVYALEGVSDPRLDPGGKTGDAPVPLEGDRVSTAEDLPTLVVDQDELELR